MVGFVHTEQMFTLSVVSIFYAEETYIYHTYIPPMPIYIFTFIQRQKTVQNIKNKHKKQPDTLNFMRKKKKLHI